VVNIFAFCSNILLVSAEDRDGGLDFRSPVGDEVSTMIKLYDAASGALVGEITAEHLAFLHAQLEEESVEDQDYYINEATLDLFAARGADPALVALLRQALGTREEMDIRWAEE
jgi:processive 1,2-diacylglycerol beta-glucosyltransferase